MSGTGTTDFDDGSAEHDVRRRDGPSAGIRRSLVPLPRERWSATPGHAGFPTHFLAVHGELRDGAANRVARLESVADEEEIAVPALLGAH